MAALIPNLSLSTLMSVVHLLEMHVSNYRAERVRTYQPAMSKGLVSPVVYGPGDELDSMHFATTNGFVAALLFDMDRNIFRLFLGRLISESLGAADVMFMEYNFSLHVLEERKPLTYEFSVEQGAMVAEVLFHHLVLQSDQVLYRENVSENMPLDTFNPVSNNFEDREAELQLERGAEHPYAGNAPQDLAERVACGILYNLGNRRGIKGELNAVDPETRQEIVSSLAKVIRVGLQGQRTD